MKIHKISMVHSEKGRDCRASGSPFCVLRSNEKAGFKASIGLLLCKSKNKDISKPIGVSEYKITSSLPDDLEKQLPSVEDIQKRIK